MIRDSELADSSIVYEGARVKGSVLKDYSSVGNFSRIDYSHLDRRVRVERNNQLFHARMGRFSYTGMNTVVMHAEIGSFCSISWNTSIGGANHDYSRMSQHSFLYNNYDGLRPADVAIPYDRFVNPTIIGNDVWIAAGATITRGVTINSGAVIGANAVVTKDVPPYAIVVGNPGRIVKYRFNEETVKLLLKVAWWDWEEEVIRKKFDILSGIPDTALLRRMTSCD